MQIPILQESQVINPSSPVPIGSSESARLEGEGLARLGQGTERLAASLIDFAARGKNALTKVQQDEAFTKGRELVWKNHQEAMSHIANNPSEDPKTTFDNFIVPLRDKFDELSTSIGDPLGAREFKAKMEEWAQKSAEDLGKEKQKQTILSVGTTLQQNINTKMAIARENPQFVDQGITEATANTLDVPDEIIDSATKQKLVRSLPAQFNLAAVEGYKSRNEFDKARAFVNDPKRQANFGEKPMDQLLDGIDKAENTYLTQDFSAKRRAKWERDEAVKNAQQKNDVMYLQSLYSAETKPLDRTAILQDMDKQFALGLVSKSVYAVAHKFDNKATQDVSTDTYAAFYLRLIDKKNLGSFEDDLQKAVGDERITTPDYIKMLGQYRLIRDKKDKESTDLDKLYLKAVQAPFKTNLLTDPTKIPELEAKKQATGIFFLENLRQGKSREEAARATFQRNGQEGFTGALGIVPAPLLNDPAAIDKRATEVIKAKAEAERIGDKDILKRLNSELSMLESQKTNVQKSKQLDDFISKAQPKKEKPSFWNNLINGSFGR